MVQQMLDDYRVDAVASAEDAFALMAVDGPHAVVIVDYALPGMQGTELLKEIQQRYPATVRIALTGTGDLERGVGALHDGDVFRFLTKPCTRDDLLHAVEHALVRHRDATERTELDDQLACARESLAGLTEDLEGRVSIQMQTLRVLHGFAVDLNASQSLAEIADRAAVATFEALQGRSVHVQLWDDDAQSGSIEAYAGGEMSSEMHREVLETTEGGDRAILGEIVVDVGDEELTPYQREVLSMIGVPTAVAARNEFRRRERDQAQHATIIALARLSEQRDNETGKHIERVSLYCSLIANSLRDRGDYTDEIDEAFIDDLVRSAPLHDIGKVGIPDAILLKPGKLTPGEWEIMKTHAEIGAETLNTVIRESKNPGYLTMGRDIAGCHHERWDGTGYPKGLRGLEIPLAARILALADIYDALSNERPYKKAWTHEKSIDWISGLGGNHLDAKVVEAFLVRKDEANQIRATYAEDAAEFAPSAF